jgi:hypothetical protein
VAQGRLDGYELVEWREYPTRGHLFTDCVGPWWDIDGQQIEIPIFEAFETAIDDVVGWWTVRSNVAGMDGQRFTIGLPHVTLIVQDEWDRVVNAPTRTARRSFLMQLDGVEPTIGAVVEHLVLQVWFSEHGAELYANGSLIDAVTCVESGLLVNPASGIRSDDLAVIDGRGVALALIESKATKRRWSSLRRPVRNKAIGQLHASAAANGQSALDLFVAATALEDRQMGLLRIDGQDHSDDVDLWMAEYANWAPVRQCSGRS